MAGDGGRVAGRAGVDAAVMATELLEDEHAVEFARLHLQRHLSSSM